MKANLVEEARAALLDVLLLPRSLCWRESLTMLQGFVTDAASPWRPALDALSPNSEVERDF